MVEKQVGANVWDGTMNLIGNMTISFHSLGSSFIKIFLMSDGIQVVHFQNTYCFLEIFFVKDRFQFIIIFLLCFFFLQKVYIYYLLKILDKKIYNIPGKSGSISTIEITTQVPYQLEKLQLKFI